jgi:8-oxo-dGTP pyrophosphatase MutT (NUDIX family)
MYDDGTSAAGFMLFKRFGDVYKTLCLYDNGGIGDIPKGRCDSTDVSLFHTAQRECMEEAGIIVMKSDLLSSEFLALDSRLTIFCAMTDQQVEIKKNHVSNKFEHESYEWVGVDNLEFLLPDYLKPGCPWAQMILNQYLTLQVPDY